jgi:hypothetical protein
MQTMKIYLSGMLFFMALLSNLQTTSAQTKQEKRAAQALEIKHLIDGQAYVFYATTVKPMSGRNRQLTADYTVDITKEKVTSDLPYFGRAYSAPIGNSDGGIKFNSTNFEYVIKDRKKGGWDIAIKPKDVQDVQVFNLSVFENGYANLQVTSTNRQSISFSGEIRKRKKD